MSTNQVHVATAADTIQDAAVKTDVAVAVKKDDAAAQNDAGVVSQSGAAETVSSPKKTGVATSPTTSIDDDKVAPARKVVPHSEFIEQLKWKERRGIRSSKVLHLT